MAVRRLQCDANHRSQPSVAPKGCLVRRTRFFVYTVSLLLSAGVVFAGTAAAADPPAPPGTPTAESFGGIATVGPIFSDGLRHDHGCTRSVVASPSRDLVLTAAHCVFGTAAGWRFVPGYADGAAPYGVWKVQRAYLDPAWLRGQDPQHDFAILQVANRIRGDRTVALQDVTGAEVLGTAPAQGTAITDIAYNAGLDDKPIRCATTSYLTDGYPAFNCHGFVGGSSGSPWLTSVAGTSRQVVVGVIGGLHQGGCYEYTSYSSAFTGDVRRLINRAARGDRPDTAPQAGSDGC